MMEGAKDYFPGTNILFDRAAVKWLLLLPQSPSENLYIKALEQSLLEASRISEQTGKLPRLFIGFPFKDSWPIDQAYDVLQEQIASMYQHVCVIMSKRAIGPENDNDVDVRVFVLKEAELASTDTFKRSPWFPTLQSIAQHTLKDWDRVQVIDNQDGALQATRLLNFAQTEPGAAIVNIEKLPNDIEASKAGAAKPSPSVQHHNSVAVGGTFDHLHAGHKLLLTMTALRPSASLYEESREFNQGGIQLTIGITSDEILKEKQFREEMQSWDVRNDLVEQFLGSLLKLAGWIAPGMIRPIAAYDKAGKFCRGTENYYPAGLIIRYVEIHDPFGPTITDKSISALVVSGETRDGGKAVNDRRRKKKWEPLSIFEVSVLNAESGTQEATSEEKDRFKGKVSSTEIRRRLHEKKANLDDTQK